MAKNIIIYPSGTTSNTNPHIVFKGDAGQIQLNVIATPGDAALQLSSSTVSLGTILDPSTGITASGFTITTGDVQVGGVSAISTGGFWKGNLANIKGAQGSQGEQGIQGIQGIQGLQGTAGFVGSNGAQGTQGTQGIQGTQGTQGIQGLKGTKITPGDTAPGSPSENDLWWDSTNGILMVYYNDGTSSQWVSANSGIAGEQGIQGVQGITGSQGTQGIQGLQGVQGIQGVQGTQGVQGIQGITGLAFTIAKTYASVAALTADTSPSGIVAGQFALINTTNVEDAENSRLYIWTGSAYTFVDDLSGSAGIQGITGSQGITGAQGITGTQGAVGTLGAQGTQGTQGIQGISGASILGTNNTWTGTNAFTTLSASSTAAVALSATRSNAGTVAQFIGPSQSAYIYTDTNGIYLGSDSSQNTALYLNETSDTITAYTGGAVRGAFSSTGLAVTGALSTTTSIFSGDSIFAIGELYVGASNTLTDNSYRIVNIGSDFTIQQRKTGTWTSRVEIDSSGNVGIATTTPYSPLNVLGTTSAAGQAYGSSIPGSVGQISIHSTDAYTSQKGGKISLSGVSGTGGTVNVTTYGTIEGYKVNASNNNAGGGLIFSTTLNASGTLAEKMRIDDSGNVGIGTSSPGASFTVQSDSVYNSEVGAIRLQTATDTNKRMFLGYDKNLNAGYIQSQQAGTNWMPTLVNPNGGNVGIGTTSPAAKLHLDGGAAVVKLRISSNTNVLGLDLWNEGAIGGHSFIDSIRDDSSYNLYFRMRSLGTPLNALTIFGTGNVGIGTASPAEKMHVVGGNIAVDSGSRKIGYITDAGASNTGYIIPYDGSGFISIHSNFASGGIKFHTNTANTERARIAADGTLFLHKTTYGVPTVGYEFRIGGEVYNSIADSTNGTQSWSLYSTTASAYRFYVGMAGTVFATNTTISGISDRRVKENIVDLDVGIDAIMALKPRKFDWKAGKGKDIKNDRGFIAQEFEKVFPDLIDTWKDEAPEGEEPYKSVRADLIPVIVKALQELKADNDALRARIAALEAK